MVKESNQGMNKEAGNVNSALQSMTLVPADNAEQDIEMEGKEEHTEDLNDESEDNSGAIEQVKLHAWEIGAEVKMLTSRQAGLMMQMLKHPEGGTNDEKILLEQLEKELKVKVEVLSMWMTVAE